MADNQKAYTPRSQEYLYHTMHNASIQWLQSKPFEQQIVVLAIALDPLGFITGYLLAPSVDVEPLIGGVFGLVAATIPMSIWVMRYARQQT